MSNFKSSKKILALILSLALITGMMPAMAWDAFAETEAQADDTTYVLAGSDFQPTDASNTTGVNLLNGILDKVDDKYTTMDGFIFAGDYDYNYSASQSGKEALQQAVQTIYGTGMDEIYIQGNHDVDSLVGSVLTSSGNNDTDNYGVFVINEKDYMWYNDDEATIKKTAESLESYLNAKRNSKYTKPIFVVSHLPLHYCMRTQVGGGDGKHANYIFDVLNEAGAAGLNIIFMFGHNHSHGWDDPYGGAAIFLKSGDKINIAQNSTTNYKEETLNFTYMNAGYVSYYRNVNSGAETDLSMTTFAITNNDVTIERYTADGLHDLKSAGVANKHAADGSSVDKSCTTNHRGNETYSPDTTTVKSGYVMTLNKNITPAGEEVVTPGTPDSGNTERTYTRVTSTSELVSGGKYLIFYNGSHFMLPEVVEKSDGSVRKGFNIESTSICGPDTITGDYTAKEWTLTSSGSGWLLGNGTQYAKLTSTTDYKITATLENSGDVFTIGGSENAFTFSNGTYVFNYNNRGLINGYASDAATFYIYRMTSEGSSGSSVDTTGGDWITITEPTEAGTKYVYELDTDGVDTGVEYLIVANSYPKALSAAASSNNAVDIEINGNYAYADSDTYGWTFTRHSNGVYYICLNNSTYLALSYNTLGSSNSTGSSRRWTVTSNNDGSYDIVRNNYNLRWSNSNGEFQASNSSEGPVRLYKSVKTETTTAQPGLYGKISGELTYNVAIGTSKEDALATVKNGIDILYHTGDANAAQTFPDDGEGMDWTLDPSYDGTTPGEYAVTITYNGVTLGVAKVVVPSVAISGYSIDPKSASVRQGAAQSVKTGSKITVTLANGDYYTVPVTISMLSKDGAAISTAEAGTQTGLTVTYNGVVITKDYTLTVTEKVLNNYPEYPDEGAVKVNKSATGVQFQSTGVAQVELSASGVPSQKGADVVVVIDTSSSMATNDVEDTGKSRIQVLSESLEQMLEQFQTPGDNGLTPDIDIAIIDFNGYFNSSAGTFDQISLSDTYRNNTDFAKIFTGTNFGKEIKSVGLSSNDFVGVDTINVESIVSEFTDENCKSGTNYDGALENAYKLLEAKQAAKGEEERDSYVIFLSDGAPFRYNGYNNGDEKSTYNGWNNYLSGSYASSTDLEAAFTHDLNYSYFYNGNGTNHPHRWAEAIKGTPGAVYPVISRDAEANPTAYQKNVNGLGATIYSIGFGLADDGNETGKVTAETQQELIEVISSGGEYNYPNVKSPEELTTAFTQIVTAINYSASNARFVDQMGDNFDLKITPITDLEGNPVTDKDGNEIPTTIEIVQYDIYQKSEVGTTVGGVKVTESMVGKRKGTSVTLETVRFNVEGTEAYSGSSNTNILTEGIINAKSFWYNTNTTSVMIDTDGDGKKDYNLEPETFYWKMGTITTYELAMRYYVYLEGAKEGTCSAGSYATNEKAILYYDNYLGNDCSKETVSPVMAWKSANVSYAFYLVDKDGNIIVNQTTGETGSFANRVAVTNPVVYEEILLNNTDQIEALQVAALGDNVLPTYYQVYDDAAAYKISIYSDATGSWGITKGNGKVASTYVTHYDPDDAAAYSNAIQENGAYDYTHTTVWFAVVWNVQAHPDAVVVDYGLPVDISVLSNDMFGENGKLAGVGQYTEGLEVITGAKSMEEEFGELYTGIYGTAKADNAAGKVRYTLNKNNGMQMQTYEEFAYAVNYTGTTNPGYYYDTITVIPATTIYYEDDFLTYYADETEWIDDVDEDTAVDDAVQDEDRPGRYSLTDANNIYGYDSVNKGMSTFSLGTAKKVHVDKDSSATAEFTFCGTGFDIIGMTSNTTGTLAIKITDVNGNKVTYADGSPVTNKVVNTYYGYEFKGGQWIPAPETDKAMYQVPVMQAENLPYGTYKVTITATYADFLDETTDTEPGYDLYLDAIRIYDPANDGITETDENGERDTTIEDAYKVDHEGWPSYIELRNQLIEAETFGGIWGNDDPETEQDDRTVVDGLVFIDGDDEVGTVEITNYESYGPNNEVYLAPGQSIAFILNTPENFDRVHLGVKSADGNNGTYTISNISRLGNAETGLKAGAYYGTKVVTIDTATDMYQDITGYTGDIIVISNTGKEYNTNGVLSLTNIKSTYTSDPNGNAKAYASRSVSTESKETSIYMTPAAAALTLRSLNASDVTDEPEVPDEPETPVDPDTPVTPEEPEDEPEVVIEKAEINSVKTGKTTYTAGDTVTVTVTTNAAAEYVTVNGQKITTYTESGDSRSWKYTKKVTTVGNVTFEAVAYNEAGDASEKASVTAVVKQFAPKTYKLTVNKASVTVKDKVKATVTTSTDVKYVTINGKKITNYVSNKSAGTRTWTYEVKTSKVGKLTFKAVAYNKNGSASKAITKYVTVKTFAPKTYKLTLSKASVTVGDKVKATVTTSTNVKYVTINGKKVTKYVYNKSKGTRTWTYEVKTSKVGKRAFKAVAYNSNGSAAKAITKYVTVKTFAPKTFNVSLSKSTVKVGEKYTVTVKTSNTVKYVKVNGIKYAKYTYNKKSGIKTFKVTYKASKVGKKTLKVVAYNKAGYASNAKSKTVTIKKK